MLPVRPSRFEAVVFDHDGTLVDTVTGDYLSCRALFEEHGVELTISRWTKTVCGNVAAYDLLFDELASSSARSFGRDELRARLKFHWCRHLTPARVTIMPGVREFLLCVHELAIPMAVATAASRDWACQWLEHFGISHFFRAIESGEKCEHNKPYPDVYLRAASALDVKPSACLAFEDSTTGIMAAKAAGMTVVAIPPKFAPHVDVTAADAVIECLADAHHLNLFGSERPVRA